MKTTLKPLLAVLCLSAFAASVSAQTIKAADVHPEGYPNVIAVQNMGEKLKQQTDGKMEIKVFPGGVLGDEKQMIEQAQIALEPQQLDHPPRPAAASHGCHSGRLRAGAASATPWR